MFGRRFADLLLFCVTSTDLVILVLLTPTFTIADWIYVLDHLIVLGIALTRRDPKVWDYSITSSMAVGAAYIYPYAQVISLYAGRLAMWHGKPFAIPAAIPVKPNTAATRAMIKKVTAQPNIFQLLL